MSKQGYLIKHDKLIGPTIHYFIAQDGYLRYYRSSEPEDLMKPIGEFALSGHKVQVKAQRRIDRFSNSFTVETRKVHTKDKSYTLGRAATIELSAPSKQDRQEWGSTIFTWQRYYWRDLPASNEKEVKMKNDQDKRQLFQLMEEFGSSRPRRTSVSGSGNTKPAMLKKSPTMAVKCNDRSKAYVPHRKILSQIGRQASQVSSQVC